MIGNNYKKKKEWTIERWKKYLDIRGVQNDGVTLEMLGRKVEHLKKGKFNLLITGELSAGKSTFINALLKEQILPSNVLQSSCAIVEIFKSDQKFVKVKYGDDHEEIIYDDLTTPGVNEAYEYLRKVAAIQEEYRDIPTTLIDFYLIAGQNPDLEELEKNSNEILKGKESIIEKYIQEHPRDKIPVEIEVGFPLPFGFDELRLVDSPGVNALGGVQDRTFEYIDNADAILFIKKIDEPEKESFRNFFKKVIPDHSQQMLFLILTHSGKCTDIKRLYNEYVKKFPEISPPKDPEKPETGRIFYVDSILRLIELDIEQGKTIDQIEDESDESDEKALVISPLLHRAKKENKEITELIRERSQFIELIKAIEDFSSKAPDQQINKILEMIKHGFKQQKEYYEGEIKLSKEQLQDPHAVCNKIDKIKAELENYKLKLNIFVNVRIPAEQEGTSRSWGSALEKLKKDAHNKISKAESIDEIRKKIVDVGNKVEEEILKTINEIAKEFDNEMKEVGKEFKDNYNIFVPKIDTESIIAMTTSESYKLEDVVETVGYFDPRVAFYAIWRIFIKKKIKIGVKKQYDQNIHIEKIKGLCNKEIDELFLEINNKLTDKITAFCNSFKSELTTLIKDRQKDLDKYKNTERKRQEINDKIVDMKRRSSVIEENLEEINTYLVNYSL